VYYHRELTARRYAARLVALVDRYGFVEILSRPVGRWQTVNRVYQGPIEPIDWDEAWGQWERRKRS
jgi:hypothetical protein